MNIKVGTLSICKNITIKMPLSFNSLNIRCSHKAFHSIQYCPVFFFFFKQKPPISDYISISNAYYCGYILNLDNSLPKHYCLSKQCLRVKSGNCRYPISLFVLFLNVLCQVNLLNAHHPWCTLKSLNKMKLFFALLTSYLLSTLKMIKRLLLNLQAI